MISLRTTLQRKPRRRFYGDGILGGLLLLLVIVPALLAPWLPLPDPLTNDLAAAFSPPGGHHLLGTDQLGRDLLSRILSGTRLSLMVVLLAAVIAAVMGSALGMIAGYTGGWLDALIMRLMDIQLAVPFILLILLVMALFGASMTNIIVIMGVTSWAIYARVARAKTLEIRELEFIESVKAMGFSTPRILLRHILPNLMTPLIVLLTLDIPRLIVLEASIGFLGMGIQPPTPTLGNLIGEGRSYMLLAQWLVLYPGLVIAALVIGCNLLGDSLLRKTHTRLD
ncbi:permease component of an ABC superfamily dipeptide transporter [Rahnella aquatilis CIP 78.65 = ATCC 33071]|uniref:ABC-type dipeptide/oligopeptide/nickel transport system, permease component n=1 Tax=Rahnella aquatilis (strain ATCC 33071 / DSM 4594 / JCM 1683 / NBRC 105701 / NCIMB 13365 / CIP 78.65) TaxID=745277 RepID=H2J0V8_RAHAC|nr:ABC transporter permease [Rahnella aquatilis]AEX52271.1 ABC-type dipeptide/oligopeptide/nickel transport system, permease component [Rahnella aquatilis CIP 78.65 = ATCC 33071]KFD09594.1 permease component of an ABC superfamily dipeptide transporter [Rahnella aquatilis CIP 78.65 = ATCC 33071]